MQGLEQGFSTKGKVSHPPGAGLATSGGILGGHSWKEGATGIEWVEVSMFNPPEQGQPFT